MTNSCVVIPVFEPLLTDLEQVSVRQVIKILSRHDLFIVAPEHLAFPPATAQILAGIEVVRFADLYFRSRKRYSRLMMAERFYRRFAGYESILIAQPDSFVFSDQLAYWSNKRYGTIGAPWFEGRSNPTPSLTITGVGNGGFCLRNTSLCLEVLTTPTRFRSAASVLRSHRTMIEKAAAFVRHFLIYNYNVEPFLPRLNEDRFWAEVVPTRFPTFTLPTIEEATAFAFEVCPEHLYRLNGGRLPFGCHGWWKYNFAFWKPFIEQQGHRL